MKIRYLQIKRINSNNNNNNENNNDKKVRGNNIKQHDIVTVMMIMASRIRIIITTK